MMVKKYFIVRYMQNTVSGPMPMYAMGYNKWTNSLSDAKLYAELKSANRIAKGHAPGGHKCELLHATLTVEDINDLLEKELDLN